MTHDELKTYIGRELQIRGVKHLCIAASETALLLLQFDRDDHPIQYIVAHYPAQYQGELVWAQGNYYMFYNPSFSLENMTGALEGAALQINCSTFYAVMADDEFGTRCIGVFTDRSLAVSELVKVMNHSDYVLGYCYEKKKECLTLEEYNVLKEELSLDNSYWIEEHKPNEASV